MPEITNDRLMTLLGSARANMQTAYKEIQHYEGAIQTLQLLIDDLRAQEIKEKHEIPEFARDADELSELEAKDAFPEAESGDWEPDKPEYEGEGVA